MIFKDNKLENLKTNSKTVSALANSGANLILELSKLPNNKP